ncbi:hypothetical protein FGO68_gene2591 [Halteria grandinella]|uniref:Uncharacterized protein n=1 Tax=Halteria grandinella TaxID=5974 RepID=A0A8J8SVT2_HALGN|nr:hypothetical protein FGO68_gene2591 [Halteria grandinella]
MYGMKLMSCSQFRVILNSLLNSQKNHSILLKKTKQMKECLLLTNQQIIRWMTELLQLKVIGSLLEFLQKIIHVITWSKLHVWFLALYLSQILRLIRITYQQSELISIKRDSTYHHVHPLWTPQLNKPSAFSNCHILRRNFQFMIIERNYRKANYWKRRGFILSQIGSEYRQSKKSTSRYISRPWLPNTNLQVN